jgi:transaldolase
MHPSNYDLIKRLKNTGYKVAATTIYDIIQINQAIEMECDYTMVYYHKNNYKNLMIDAYELKQKTNSNIKLVGASIRSQGEVMMAIKAGMDYVTIKSNVMDEIFQNKQLDDDLKIINNLI